MLRIPLVSLLILFGVLVLCSAAHAAYIGIETDIPTYIEDDHINITGYLWPETDYIYEYYYHHFTYGTTYNLTFTNSSMHLDPDINITELNSGNSVFSGASGMAWDTFIYQFDIVKSGSTYYLFYTGSSNATEGGVSHIGLATSTDGLSWSRYSSLPVLEAGKDTYDYYGLSDPKVLVVNGTWHMWYAGNHGSGSADIDVCYATSKDGYIWTKYASNPVRSNDDNSSAWNGTEIRPQGVFKEGGMYKMYYLARGTSKVSQLGLMTSLDGASWTENANNPLYKGKAGWEKNETRFGTVEAHNGSYRIWTCGGGSAGWSIGYIYSWDGENWTDSGSALVSPKTNSWYDQLVRWPVVVREGAGYKLFCQGMDKDDVRTYGAFKVTPVRLNGTYTSRLYDFKAITPLVEGWWAAANASYIDVSVFVRYGNSTDSLTSWKEVPENPFLEGTQARYLQYKAEFRAAMDWYPNISFNYFYIEFEIAILTFQYRMDYAPYVNLSFDANYTWELNLTLVDGNHVLELMVTDAATRPRYRNVALRVDHYAPTGDILIEWGANATPGSRVTVLLTANDTFPYFEVYMGVYPTHLDLFYYMGPSATVNWLFDDDLEGNVTLYVKYMDPTFKESPIYNDSIMIDRHAPEATLEINGGSGYANTINVTLGVNWTDMSGVSLMWVANTPFFDDVEWMLPVNELEWQITGGEGVKTVYVRLMDFVGWTTNLSANVTLDETIPTGSIEINGGYGYTSDPRVDLSLTMADDSPMSIQLANDEDDWTGEWLNVPPTWDMRWGLDEAGPDGNRTVRMLVRDAAGNQLVVADDIVLDRTPPVVEMSLNEGATLTRNMRVNVRLEASDATSGLHQMIVSNSLRFPDDQWRDFEETFQWTVIFGDGDKRVYVMVRDRACPRHHRTGHDAADWGGHHQRGQWVYHGPRRHPEPPLHRQERRDPLPGLQLTGHGAPRVAALHRLPPVGP
jgi:predicted GH43/DUF377 family glycosyl hydrolase